MTTKSTITSLDDYQIAASRTHAADQSRRDALANFGLGIAGEAGEVADLIKKHLFQGHLLDRKKLKFELGDVLWYVAGLATKEGLDLSEVAWANIDKLRARYPDGFDEARSVARASVPEPPPQPKGIDVTADLLSRLEGSIKSAGPGAKRRLQEAHQLVQERRAYGVAKYGQSLHTEDGRNTVEDARQEAGDLLQYVHKARLNGEDLRSVRRLLIVVMDTVDLAIREQREGEQTMPDANPAYDVDAVDAGIERVSREIEAAQGGG